jgi:6-phosphogluconate dehydrogenase
MELGMIGLGRMGSNMVLRLLRAGHHCVVYDTLPTAAQPLVHQGARAVASLAELVTALTAPRAIWMMVPAGVVDPLIGELAPRLAPGDVLVDGGNSFYRHDIRRAGELRSRGIHYLDVGTSGGVWGLERGYCLMIGGEVDAVRRLDSIFAALAPGVAAAPRTSDATGPARPAEQGYLHCGPSGAGHFVKMIHNGIEYGLMAAYAEGLSILRHANVGKTRPTLDAETTPLEHPEAYQYDFNLADVAEVWRRGSVISSWLLDLTARALAASPELEDFSGRVSDSGEGRWTLQAAIDEAVPAGVLATALFQRFSSRGEQDFADKLLSAMRFQFGGHHEKRGPTA